MSQSLSPVPRPPRVRGFALSKGVSMSTLTIVPTIIPERTTANEIREALTYISHTLRLLRAVGADTEGVMRYADHLLDRA